MAAAVANAEKVAEVEEQSMIAAFDSAIEDLGARLQTATDEAARFRSVGRCRLTLSNPR